MIYVRSYVEPEMVFYLCKIITVVLVVSLVNGNKTMNIGLWQLTFVPQTPWMQHDRQDKLKLFSLFRKDIWLVFTVYPRPDIERSINTPLTQLPQSSKSSYILQTVSLLVKNFWYDTPINYQDTICYHFFSFFSPTFAVLFLVCYEKHPSRVILSAR